jgi:hypothetical protein
LSLPLLPLLLHRKELAAAAEEHTTIRKIVPLTYCGEFILHNVTFSIPVLQDISLYFPVNETTFIVRDLSPGNSTIA